MDIGDRKLNVSPPCNNSKPIQFYYYYLFLSQYILYLGFVKGFLILNISHKCTYILRGRMFMYNVFECVFTSGSLKDIDSSSNKRRGDAVDGLCIIITIVISNALGNKRTYTFTYMLMNERNTLENIRKLVVEAYMIR